MLKIPAKITKPNVISCISETSTTLVFNIGKLFPDIIQDNKASYTFSIKDLTIDNYGQELFKYINTHFYINGTQLNLMQNKVATVDTNGKLTDIIFNVYCDNPDMKYEFRLECEVSYNDKKHNIIIIHTSDAEILSVYNNSGIDTISNGSAFALLRTNPKLTGNVKLVVSNNRLYMDTFRYKTADALSNVSVRKKLLSSYGDYPNDLFRVFGKLDSNTFMDVIPDCYNPYKVYTNPAELYNTTYEYGCEKNTDKLYKENFKLLAPLHLGHSLPDYFLIFAKPVSTTQLNLETNTTSLYDHIKYGRIVKAFSLKEDTVYGAYLRNYAKNLEKYSLDNIYYNGTKIKHVKTTDTVMGIDYKYGVFTEKQFMSSDDVLIEKLNTYYTNSFKSKNLVYPWILNLEFMFDDPEATDYHIYNYYGFYVTENEFQHISKVIDSQNSITNIRTFYNGSKILDINDILDKSISKFDTSECMFSVSSDKDFQVLRTKDDFDIFIKKNILNVPGLLLAKPRVKKFLFNDIESFLTIKFDKLIKPGEHFRFIISDYNELFRASTIYEIIASNNKNLCRYNVPISQYVLTNKIKDCNIYSLCFYTNKEDGSDELADLKDQIFRLSECIAKFRSFLSTGFVGKDSISINSLEENVLFQHIAEPATQAGDIDHLHYINCDNNTEFKDIHRFNSEFLYPFNNPVYDTNDCRVSTLVKFVEVKSFNNFKLYEISDEIDEALNEAPIPMYLSASGDYKPLQNINVITNNSVMSMLDIDDRYIIEESLYIFLSPYTEGLHFIALKEEPILFNGCLNIFSSDECSINILGFLNIKDLDSQVDSPRSVNYNSSSDIVLENKYILLNDNKTLRRFVKYIIIDGGFLNLDIPSGSAFMFVENNQILHFNKKRSYFSKVPDTGLVTNGITRIRPDDMVSAGYYNYSYSLPGMSSNNFISLSTKNMILDINKPLSLSGSNGKMLNPIVPALAFNWEITGTSFDNNKLIRQGDYSAYNLVNMQGTFYDTGAATSIPSLDKIVIYNDETLTIRELIKKHPVYLKILYKDLPTASCHYNEVTGSIEFVYNNILFKLNVTESASDTQRPITIPNNIFNMKIAVINDFNMSMDNELFISEKDYYMLLVNHQYFTGGDYRYANNIKYYADSIYCINYYWTPTPYKLSLIDAFYDDENNQFMFPMQTNNASGISDILSEINTEESTYIQIGYPLYKYSVDLLEPSVYFQTAGNSSVGYNSHTGYYSMCKNNQTLIGHDLWDESRNSKTTSVNSSCFANYFTLASRYDPNHFSNINTLNENDGIPNYDVIDKADNRLYNNFILSDLKYNNGYNESTSVDTLIKWTKSIADNSINIWLVSENNEPTLLDSTGLSIDVVPPDNNNKFPDFFIKPAFKNIITFRSSDMIAKSIGVELKNTGVIPDSVFHIDAYPYNIISRVSTTNDESLESLKPTIKNFSFMPKNILIPSWRSGNLPKDYKTSLSNVSLYQLAPYTSLKSFFGSCCVAIPPIDNIEITVSGDFYNISITTLKRGENVNSNLNIIQSQVKETGSVLQNTNIVLGTSTQSMRSYKMTINITEVFINYIMSQPGFYTNWSRGLTGVKKLNNTQMTDFIKKLILPSYNLENVSIILKARIVTPIKQNNQLDNVYPSLILTDKNSFNDFVINNKIPEMFIDNNKVNIKKQNNGDIVMEIVVSTQNTYFVTPVLTIPKV